MVAITTRVIPRQLPSAYLFPARALLPVAPWVIIISALGATTPFDGALFAMWVAIHGVTLFAAGFTGMALSALIGRAGKTTVTLWWVVGMGAFVGAVKALTTVATEEALGLADAPPEAILARAIGGVVVGVWVIPIMAFGSAALDRLTMARDDVIRRNVATRLSEEAGLPRSEVSDSLAAISALRRQLASPTTRPQTAEIRAVVDSTIRPLSRALWAVENRRYPTTKLVAFYRIALQSFRARAWLIALVWSATSFTALAAPTGIRNAAVYASIAGLIAFVVFSTVRLGWTTSVAVSLVVVTLSSFGTVTLGYLLSRIVLGSEPLVADLVLIFSGAAWMALVVVGSSILSGVLKLRDVIEADLDTSSTKELINKRATDDATTASARRLAARLHGSVQSGLLGLAAALDRGAITLQDVDGKLADIVGELELLDQSESHLGHGAGAAPGSYSLRDVVSQWRGIVAVDIDDTAYDLLEPFLAGRPEGLEVIREALTNAHRHGRATIVTITATADPSGDITVSVTDNGYGPTTGTPGLGSTLLDTWTQSRWSLEQAPTGGSRLVATLSPHHQATTP